MSLTASGQSLRAIIAYGDTVPGTDGAKASDVLEWTVSDTVDGRRTYAAFVAIDGGSPAATSDNDHAAVMIDGNDLALIFREGNPAPEIPGGVFLGGERSPGGSDGFRFAIREPLPGRHLFTARADWPGSHPPAAPVQH